MRQKLRLFLRALWKYRWPYIFIIPDLIVFGIFVVYPMFYSLYLSFTNYNGATAEWIGFLNYRKLFLDDEKFLISVINTVYYTAVTVVSTSLLALLVALAINGLDTRSRVGRSGQTIFKLIYYLPVMVAGVATYVLWQWMYNTRYGLINWALSLIGIPGKSWLNDMHWALPSIMFMSLWTIGSGVIIYLAGLKGIPDQLYEAAQIDGANIWQRFRYITIPSLYPVLFFVLIMATIGSFQAFGQIYVMTGGSGGPLGRAALTMVFHLYNNAFIYFRLGYASAIAYILFIMVFAFILIQIRLFAKREAV